MKKIFKTCCLSLALPCLLGIGVNLEAGVFTVALCSFRFTDYYSSNNIPWFANTWGLHVDSSPHAGYIEAPLNLPNGVTIKKITIYFTHRAADDYHYFNLECLRVKMSTGTAENIAYLTTNGLPASDEYPIKVVLSGSQLTNKTVNNNTYAYCVRIFFPTYCTELEQVNGIVINY